MTQIHNRREMRDRRRQLRGEMPICERRLWQCLRGKKICDVRFHRQHSIGSYVVDFYAPSVRLAVEVDGESHESAEGQQSDRERTQWLERQGVNVLRVKNEDVVERIGEVVSRIEEEVRRLMSK